MAHFITKRPFNRKYSLFIALGLILLFINFTASRAVAKPVQKHNSAYCYGQNEKPIAQYFSFSRFTLFQPQGLNDYLAGKMLFTPYQKDLINFGTTNDEIWLKAEVYNCTSETQDLLLSFNILRAALLQVYLIDDKQVNTLFDNQISGATIANIKQFNTLSARYILTPNQRKTLLIRKQTANNTHLPLSINETWQQGFATFQEKISLVGIIAAITTLILFNAILFVFMQQKVFLYFALFEFFHLFYLAHMNAWTTLYLWGEGPWNLAASGIIGSLASTMSLIFIREYFNAKALLPLQDRFIKLMIGLGFFFITFKSISAFFPAWSSSQINAWGYGILFISQFLAIYVALYCTIKIKSPYKTERLSRFLVLFACILLTSNVLLFAFKYLSLIPFNSYTLNHSAWMLLAESSLIAFALAIRIRSTYKERELKLKQVNQLQYQQMKQSKIQHATLQEKAIADHAAIEAGKLILAVGHDGKQMLGALNNYTSLLQQQLQPFKQSQLNQITQAMQNVIQVLSDVLNNALNTGGRDIEQHQVNIEQFSSQDLFQPLNLIYKHSAWDKKLALHFFNSKHPINSDRVILLRIIGNLLNNAITHSENGKLLIACRHRKHHTLLQIWDSGKGMSAEKRANLLKGPMDIKQMAEQSFKQNLGIGLKASADLAIKINASINIKSQLGKGTIAEVILPHPSAARPPLE